jgi:hypothetical protein
MISKTMASMMIYNTTFAQDPFFDLRCSERPISYHIPLNGFEQSIRQQGRG